MANTVFSRLKRLFMGRPVVVRFILINAAVFLLVHAAAAAVRLSGGGADLWTLLTLPGSFGGVAVVPWTVVTYMFTHIDPFHILANMLWLYLFGSVFSEVYSGRSFIAAYLLGGVAGAAAYLAAGTAEPLAGLVGASAAVLSVAAATVARVPNYRVNLWLLGMVKIKWVALALVLFSLLASGGLELGSQAAHLGGIAAGVAVAMDARFGIVSRRRRRKKAVVLAPLHGRPAADGPEMEKRLDELLEKVSVSGYNSLTSNEKKELNDLSGKIKV